MPRVASFPSDASAESQRDMFANSPTQDQDFARKLSSKFLLQRFFGVCSVFHMMYSVIGDECNGQQWFFNGDQETAPSAKSVVVYDSDGNFYFIEQDMFNALEIFFHSFQSLLIHPMVKNWHTGRKIILPLVPLLPQGLPQVTVWNLTAFEIELLDRPCVQHRGANHFLHLPQLLQTVTTYLSFF